MSRRNTAQRDASETPAQQGETGLVQTEREAYILNFQQRVIQDALDHASAAFWDRRATQFEAVGNTRCDETAAACRNAAAYWRWRAGGELT